MRESLKSELAARGRTLGRILTIRSWVVTAGVVAWTVLGAWRDEGPQDSQPPLIADVLAWLPWWAWVMVALIVVCGVVFEGAHRYIKQLVEPDLVWELPYSGNGWNYRRITEPLGGRPTRTHFVSDLKLINRSQRKLVLTLHVRIPRNDRGDEIIPATGACLDVAAFGNVGKLPHLPTEINLGPNDVVRGHAEFVESLRQNIEEAPLLALANPIYEATDLLTGQKWNLIPDAFEMSDEDMKMMLIDRATPSPESTPDKAETVPPPTS